MSPRSDHVTSDAMNPSPNAAPVELRSVELLQGGERLVIGFVDPDGCAIRLELPVWGAHQLVRALLRLRVAPLGVVPDAGVQGRAG